MESLGLSINEEYLRFNTGVEAKSLPLFFIFGNRHLIYCGGIKLNNNMQIITNNISVLEKYRSDLDITYIEGQYIDVLKSVRDRVHKGYKLISHPLMGSIKPNETPYRSVVITSGTGLDYDSLSVIESSIATCEKLLKDRPAPAWNERILKDFQLIDLDLIKSAMDSLGNS